MRAPRARPLASTPPCWTTASSGPATRSSVTPSNVVSTLAPPATSLAVTPPCSTRARSSPPTRSNRTSPNEVSICARPATSEPCTGACWPRKTTSATFSTVSLPFARSTSSPAVRLASRLPCWTSSLQAPAARVELERAADSVDGHVAVPGLQLDVSGHALDRDALEGRGHVGGRDTRELDASVLVAHLDDARGRRLDLEVGLEAGVLAAAQLVPIRADANGGTVSREPQLDAVGEGARLLFRGQEHDLAQLDLDDAGRAGADAHLAERVLDLES